MFLEKIVRQIEEAELAEAREKWKRQYTLEAQRSAVIAALEARFGGVPAETITAVNSVSDEFRLDQLLRFAATCPDLAAFAAELASDSTPGP